MGRRKRKGLTTRTRFEVFKRDGFTCTYCGRKPPEVVLQVDHIEPHAQGGEDSFLNYTTACDACNGGKSDIPLSDDSAVAVRRRELDRLHAIREQQAMMLRWQQELANVQDEATTGLANLWKSLAPGWEASPTGRQKIAKLATKFGVADVAEAMRIAALQYLVLDADARATRESWIEAFDKIGGICVTKRRDAAEPHLREMHYIWGILRNRFPGEAEKWRVLALLRRGVALDWDLEWMKGTARDARSWYRWRRDFEDLLRDDEMAAARGGAPAGAAAPAPSTSVPPPPASQNAMAPSAPPSAPAPRPAPRAVPTFTAGEHEVTPEVVDGFPSEILPADATLVWRFAEEGLAYTPEVDVRVETDALAGETNIGLSLSWPGAERASSAEALIVTEMAMYFSAMLQLDGATSPMAAGPYHFHVDDYVYSETDGGALRLWLSAAGKDLGADLRAVATLHDSFVDAIEAMRAAGANDGSNGADRIAAPGAAALAVALTAAPRLRAARAWHGPSQAQHHELEARRWHLPEVGELLEVAPFDDSPDDAEDERAEPEADYGDETRFWRRPPHAAWAASLPPGIRVWLVGAEDWSALDFVDDTPSAAVVALAREVDRRQSAEARARTRFFWLQHVMAGLRQDRAEGGRRDRGHGWDVIGLGTLHVPPPLEVDGRADFALGGLSTWAPLGDVIYDAVRRLAPLVCSTHESDLGIRSATLTHGEGVMVVREWELAEHGDFPLSSRAWLRIEAMDDWSPGNEEAMPGALLGHDGMQYVLRHTHEPFVPAPGDLTREQRAGYASYAETLAATVRGLTAKHCGLEVLDTSPGEDGMPRVVWRAVSSASSLRQAFFELRRLYGDIRARTTLTLIQADATTERRQLPLPTSDTSA